MPFRYVSRQAQLIKSYYSGIGKTAVIFPAAFLASGAWAMLGFGMVFYLREIHAASAGKIGAFFGLWNLSYVLGCLLVRPLTDSVRPRYLLITGTSCMCLLPLAMHYGGSLPLAYVFFGLLGVSSSLFWPPLAGWLSTGLEGAALGKVMSRFSLSWSTGAIITLPLAGWLSQKAAVLPVYAASALSLLASFLLAGAALALPRVRGDQYSAVVDGESHVDVGRATLLRYAAWVGLFTTYVVMGVIMNIFPVSAKEDLHISKSVIGILMFSRTLFLMVGFGILGHTTFWHYRSSQMLLGQLALAGCLLAMVYARHPLMVALVLAFVGLLEASSNFNGVFHGIAGSANRAARSAVHESLLAAGLISGSLLGGIMYQYSSITKVYLTCAGVVLAGVLVQATIALWVRRVGTD